MKPFFDFILQDAYGTLEEDNEYIIILSCGCSLTLCLLTLMILLWHFMENKCGITLMHAQVTFMLALLMITIILKIAKFLNKVSSHLNHNFNLHGCLSVHDCVRILAVAKIPADKTQNICIQTQSQNLLDLAFNF